MTNLWTLVLFSAIIYDYSTSNGLHDLLIPIAAIYTGVLAIYSTEKEFMRWRHLHTTKHPGEIYVIIWTVLIFSILIAGWLTRKYCGCSLQEYHFPAEVVSAYIVVMGILAITKQSKSLYLRNTK